jgi:nucleoid-associated protein YgaU
VNESKQASRPGWIVIPNSGKVPVDPTEDPKASSDTVGGSEGSTSSADLRAHAARDVEFEPEPNELRRQRRHVGESGGASGSDAGRAPQPRAASHSEGVEATEHLVERGENYWTISRQYWGSGRYYKALWKANEAKHPDINVLHVGDVIIVPPLEDLDSSLFLPSNARTRSVSLAAAGEPAAGGQRLRPDGETSNSDASKKGRTAAAPEIFDRDSDQGESRMSARPRPAASAPGRPIYRVRPYDTLRSIARDTLGTARRADEILDLNRGLIDDPTQLVVGQILELPEDARASMRRSSRR